MFSFTQIFVSLWVLLAILGCTDAQDILGCGGFVKSEVEINFSLVEVKLYTKQGSLKYQTDCAPNNGYYMIPIYDKGEYVLKVEPPPGWTFDPQSVDLQIDGKNDKCSKGEDINFQFTGFGVVGRVISKGQQSGPAGVTIILSKEGSDQVLKQVVSAEGGLYTFEKVLPGDYNIKASHPTWTFETASSKVKVGRETGSAGSSLVVLGYDVKGQVMSEGQPIKGVNFILFSESIKDVKGCDKTAVKGFTSPGSQQPLCHAVSQEDGVFTFPSLPVAKYTVVPFYKGDHITFDVVPTQLHFTVDHSSLVIQDTFDVAGFSVSGRVLNTKGGGGVAKAKVMLNGKEHTMTAADGSYNLDSMKAGTYSIQVQANQVFFDETTVKVTPNTPQLPDIIATRFSLCGQVIIDKIPEGLSQVPQQRELTLTSKDEKTEVSTLDSDSDGSFCAEVKPGTYILKVVLSEAEKKAGLKLAPDQKEVTVVKQPVGGITFSQFRAKVEGTASCLENCGILELALSSVGRSDEKRTVRTTPTTEGAAFVFHDVMPGKYRVILNNEEWCWKEKILEVEVVDSNVANVNFAQSGYILKCSLSHDIRLDFAQENKPGNVGTFNLAKGVNKFCLAEPGAYKLTPVSCHQFEQDTYRYDTSNPIVLTMTAVKHKLEGAIVTQERKGDIMVTIKSSIEKDMPTVIGPLKSDKEPKATPSDGSKAKPVEPTGPFTYQFTYWARTGEKLDISVASQELLFYPASTEVTIHGETCPGEVAQFEGRQGVFIIGQITPALAGVDITIIPQDTPDKKIHIQSNDKGAYKVGPLHGDTNYEVTAEKEGYVMTEVGGRQGHFRAFKLAEIIVKVLDEKKQPLQGVLLSLSGGVQYRSNKLTYDNGTMAFTSLSPGQYFLRPMMKEYTFLPSAQMIDVLEGSAEKLEIEATRIAFSCYGAVTSLNGEAEPGVFVEAVGQGTENCAQLQEESKTEQDGSYRIRGLQPDCDYEIRLKGGDVNQHIERAAPKSRIVKVVDSDLQNINVIAFRRMNQLDLSGNIVTDTEHLSSLKIHLYKEDNLDAAIHTISLSSTSFFYLPSLTIDNQKYLVRLDSSLSRSSYDYSNPEIIFTANTSYKHFTFKFEPQRRVTDQDLNQSSFLILPLALLIILAGYHHQKILPFLMQGSGAFQNMLLKQQANINHPAAGGPPLELSAERMADLATVGKKKKVPTATLR